MYIVGLLGMVESYDTQGTNEVHGSCIIELHSSSTCVSTFLHYYVRCTSYLVLCTYLCTRHDAHARTFHRATHAAARYGTQGQTGSSCSLAACASSAAVLLLCAITGNVQATAASRVCLCSVALQQQLQPRSSSASC